MTLIRSLAISMALFSTALPRQACAGASLFVDDAAMTPPGQCQLESWTRIHSSRQEFTAAPACTLARTEFSLGLSHFLRPAHGPVASLGIKRLFRDFDVNEWGVGASLGATWDGANGRLDGWNLNIPASVGLDAQCRTVLHLNLGLNALRDGPEALTAGLGVERVLAANWTLLGEAYGDHRGGFAAQLGLRRRLAGDASLDIIVGHQDRTASAPWLTVGFNFPLPN